jgi:chromosome partitioning protein
MPEEIVRGYDPDAPRIARSTLEDLKALWGRANDSVEAKRIEALRPSGVKGLRKFSLAETCELLDIHAPAFYEFVADKPQLQGEKQGQGRFFTLAQINQLRALRGQSPRDLYGISRAFCLAIANFKGGVAKTFTASTFAQYLALRGWRVLLVDLDPQASLSTTFGLNSADTDDWKTVLPYLYGREFIEADGQEFPKSFRESVQKTYWDGIDLVAANLSLYSGDFYLALRRQQAEGEFPFHRPLADALEDIRGDYDIIILDTPPSLSLTTTGALFAADGVLVPTQAELIDYESARAFIRLATEMLEGIGKGFNDTKTFELFRVLITRYKSTQISTAQDILAVFGERCLPEPMVDSAAVSRQLGDLTTIYEADPRKPGRAVLKRALSAANDVYGLLEKDIVRVFAEAAAAHESPAKAYGT